MAHPGVGLFAYLAPREQARVLAHGKAYVAVECAAWEVGRDVGGRVDGQYSAVGMLRDYKGGGGIQRGDEGYEEGIARGGRAIKKGMARDRERGARGEGRARGGCLKDGARVDDGAVEIVVRGDGDRVLSPVHLGAFNSPVSEAES